MRIPLIMTNLLALLACLALAEGAQAKDPFPGKPMPAPPPMIVAVPASGEVIILCRNFSFGVMPGERPERIFEVTYEQIMVRDASGGTRKIYAPVQIMITHEFKAAVGPIGADGTGLASGECGAVGAVITGATARTRLQFANFPSLYLSEGKKFANDQGFDPAVNLPRCPSGLHRFRTLRQNPNDFYMGGPSDVTCL